MLWRANVTQKRWKKMASTLQDSCTYSDINNTCKSVKFIWQAWDLLVIFMWILSDLLTDVNVWSWVHQSSRYTLERSHDWGPLNTHEIVGLLSCLKRHFYTWLVYFSHYWWGHRWKCASMKTHRSSQHLTEPAGIICFMLIRYIYTWNWLLLIAHKHVSCISCSH